MGDDVKKIPDVEIKDPKEYGKEPYAEAQKLLEETQHADAAAKLGAGGAKTKDLEVTRLFWTAFFGQTALEGGGRSLPLPRAPRLRSGVWGAQSSSPGMGSRESSL